MRKYQVVIEKYVIYEVEAEDEMDAEDVAWNLYSSDALHDCEPVVSEVLEVEQIFLVAPNPSSEGFFFSG